jgi:hypothetical protein
MVEFALVSVILFMLLLGIIELGRFLLVYNVVSNSAQEGVRYGIIRPRDLYSASEATNRKILGTPIATQVIVPDGACNIVDKTREKVWGLPRADLLVNVWFDDGDGTPTVVPVIPETVPEVIVHGSRINVQATYRYQFIVPFFSMFAPNGVNVRMNSARTILRNGDQPDPCTVNVTPVPSYTASPTRTPTRAPTAPGGLYQAVSLKES